MKEEPHTPVMSRSDEGKGATATATRPHPAPPKLDRMPQWKVLLHNDDLNDMGYVVETIVTLTPLRGPAAISAMLEAHRTGISLLFMTHREHAELLQEQFNCRQLTVTIEPDR